MLESVVLICGHCQGLLLHLRITFDPSQWWTLISVALKHIEPKREQFERVTRYDIDAMQARLDYLEGHIAELEARLDELGP